MFMLQYQPQIHRVIALFALVCVAIDIWALIQRSSTDYTELPNVAFAIAVGLIPDLLLLGYFFTAKDDFRFPVGGDRTPRDWNKPSKTTSSSYPTIHSLVLKGVALVLLLVWPIYEIITTSKITQPLYASSTTGTGDYDGGFTRISPLISNFVVNMHLTRARNAISLSMSVLLAIDIRISFSRWNLGRKALPKA